MDFLFSQMEKPIISAKRINLKPIRHGIRRYRFSKYF